MGTGSAVVSLGIVVDLSTSSVVLGIEVLAPLAVLTRI